MAKFVTSTSGMHGHCIRLASRTCYHPHGEVPVTGKNQARVRARKIKAVVLDVDGVLTDGRLFYTSRGESLKAFHSRDGFALKLAQSMGIAVAILSGRGGPVLRRRAADLGIPSQLLVEESRDKAKDFLSLCQNLGLPPENVAYMGDDIPDLPVFGVAGLACAPADAPTEVQELCDFVATSPGGRGAVRELVVFLLQTQGLWARVLSSWQGAEK